MAKDRKAKVKFLILQMVTAMLLFQTLVWFSIMVLWWVDVYSMSSYQPIAMFGYVSLINTMSCLCLVLAITRNSKQFFLAFSAMDMISLLAFFLFLMAGLASGQGRYLGLHSKVSLTHDVLLIVTMTAQGVVAVALLLLTFEHSLGSLRFTQNPPSSTGGTKG